LRGVGHSGTIRARGARARRRAMTVHKTIELSEDDAAFLERAVAEGRYASPSEAVREALALLADAERLRAPGGHRRG